MLNTQLDHILLVIYKLKIFQRIFFFFYDNRFLVNDDHAM